MTVVEADGPSYATVYPCDQPIPVASNLNFVAGQTVPNLVIARVDAKGKVCIYLGPGGGAHLLAGTMGTSPLPSEHSQAIHPTRSHGPRSHGRSGAVPTLVERAHLSGRGSSTWAGPDVGENSEGCHAPRAARYARFSCHCWVQAL